MRVGRVRITLGASLWVGAGLTAIVLGAWGQLAARQQSDISVPEALYRTARLFTLNLDLAMAPGYNPPLQLWIAAVLAPLVLARGVVALFGERLRGATVRFLLSPKLVVFGTGHRAEQLVRAEQPGRRSRYRAPVVVADLDRSTIAQMRERGAWAVRSDGLSDAALRRAAVGRAQAVVVVTGDDRRNAAIARRIQGFGQRRGRQVFVEISDPGLARTLERSDLAGTETVVPFTSLALAAADVMDRMDAVAGPVLDDRPDPPTLALFGQGPLVDALVLDLRRRRRVWLLARQAGSATPARESGPPHPRPRVLVVGPDAEARHAALRSRLGAELELIEVSTVEDSLDQSVELRPETARRLLDHRLARVVVAVPDDLAGGAIALTLAGHLGPGRRIGLVTVGPASTFGEIIAEQSGGTSTERPPGAHGAVTDPAGAMIDVFRVPTLAYSLGRLRAHRSLDRLARALYGPADPRTWAELPEAERQRLRGRAEREHLRAGDGSRDVVRWRSNAFMAFEPPEIRVMADLGVANLAAFAEAGLSAELRDPRQLVAIGRRLLATGAQRSAVDVWCEVARLAAEPELRLLAEPQESDETAELVRRILRLRRAQLGGQAVGSRAGPLAGDGQGADSPVAAADRPRPSSGATGAFAAGGAERDRRSPGTDMILVLAGPGTPPTELAALLTRTLGGRVPFDGSVVVGAEAAGIADTLEQIARSAPEPAECATAPPAEPVPAAGRADPAVQPAARPSFEVRRVPDVIRFALELWAGPARGELPGRAPRVLALPGRPTPWQQVQVLRTLGAQIGWLPVSAPGEAVPGPRRELLGGAAGVVDLPVDWATVRAFLRPPDRWSRPEPSRERLAEAVHARYVDSQRSVKDADDPAMQPFARLSPALRQSNLAVVDDIEGKLACIGLEVCAAGEAEWPEWPDTAAGRLPDRLELLAELEHGRWSAERLLAGWAAGARDTTRFVSPHLQPWAELPEEYRRYDRDQVCGLRPLLTGVGLGVRPIERDGARDGPR